ncbi:TRAP transporter substrate-binding protein DctP [Rhodoblastus sp.]|uniref:TRAP transporter substrate-binding protein DctP n=1 Tax=Rhodoblastus sp. TaxID=1962975 RepID=UPI003F9DBCCA
MPRRLLLALAILSISNGVWAAEVRIAFPAAYADDVFVKSLLSSKVLADAGVTLAQQKAETEGAAMQAVKTGAADIGVFTLADEDLHKLQKAGTETSLLTRPFMFKSADEVFLMQKSFLGDAAANDAGRSGLFPLQLWNHAITYFLTKEPIRSADDFKKLTVTSDYGAPAVKILNAVGAKTSDATPTVTGGASNAIETQLGAKMLDYAAKYNGKLYLTTGWPETGLLAAAPASWMKLSEAEKNALKTAAEQARQASDAAILARDEAMRKIPNVEVNQLAKPQQMQLAMRSEGDGHAVMSKEIDLWRKAEAEVHAKPSPKPAPPAAPVKMMAARSPVLFVTDRNDEGTLDYKTRFGSRRLDPFEYTCGYVGSPARNSGEPHLPPAPKTLTKGVEECAKLIVAKTREAGGSKVMIVIHGFNIAFDSLLWRALQLGSDVDYDGAIVGWSWPSEGSAFGYAYDEDSSTWSEPHLVELVSEIAAAGPELQLDFVAHSMGNRMLLQMLREFAQAKSKLRIGAAVFAAPDVAQDVFREQIRMARKIGMIRTLYASQYDRAILISESYHQAPRAGSGGDNILVTGGIESVDTRLGGHSYVFDEPKAISDFKQILNKATLAPLRGLEEKEKAGAPYWVIEP